MTNARDVHGPVVAEHAIALAFALARRLPQAVQHQQQKHWAQHDLWNAHPRPRELSGATMTIVGMGGIGRPLAKLAKAFGMRVVGVREHPEHGSDVPTPFMASKISGGRYTKAIALCWLCRSRPRRVT